MQEVHVHVCVEVCSSLPLTSGIVLNIIFEPAMTSAMTWWSHAEKKTRSKALAQFLRHEAKKLRWIFIDSQGYVSIHDICNQLDQGSKRKDKGKGKRRRHFSWTPQDIEDVVSTSVSKINGPRFQSYPVHGEVTHVRARYEKGGWKDDNDDAWEDWYENNDAWGDDEGEDDAWGYDNERTASSIEFLHPQPPPGTSGLNGQSPPWRPHPAHTNPAKAPPPQALPVPGFTLPANAPPSTSLPAPAPTIPAKAHPPFSPAPASAPAKAPPPILPAPASSPPAKAPPPILPAPASPPAKAPPPILPAPASPPAKAPPPTLPAPASAMPEEAAPPSMPATAAAEPAAAPIAQPSDLCVVCCQHPATHGFVHTDAVHQLVCWECAATYTAQNAATPHDDYSQGFRFCPMCRRVFSDVLPVYPMRNQ